MNLVTGGKTMSMCLTRPRSVPLSRMKDWPAEAKLILSALETGRFDGRNRRTVGRIPFRTKALLNLYSDDMAVPREIYTHDLHCRGLGFITPHRLPLGHGGTIDIPMRDAPPMRIACTLLRCRETVSGWFEGAVYFNRPQDWMEETEEATQGPKERNLFP
jgi:hypothetical protein